MTAVRWVLGILVAATVLAVPFGYYRAGYVHARRLRVVTPDKFYRCGQLPADGFKDAFRRFGIKCVVNIREEDAGREPLLPNDWLASWAGRTTIGEQELCRQEGVRYIQINGGVLDDPDRPAGSRPQAVDDFLAICDDPTNYPLLVHCKAGRDRTGLFTAIYRMEYEGRTKAEAVSEMRANGFATVAATDGNAYLDRLILKYEPGVRRPAPKSAGGGNR